MLNLWKKFWGRKYRIIYVKEGLEENEVLFLGHKIYIKEGKR